MNLSKQPSDRGVHATPEKARRPESTSRVRNLPADSTPPKPIQESTDSFLRTVVGFRKNKSAWRRLRRLRVRLTDQHLSIRHCRCGTAGILQFLEALFKK